MIVVIVLGKFAWGPVLGLLRQREEFIHRALSDAKRDRDDHCRQRELDRGRKVRKQFLRHRHVIGERVAEIAVHDLDEIGGQANVPRLV